MRAVFILYWLRRKEALSKLEGYKESENLNSNKLKKAPQIFNTGLSFPHNELGIITLRFNLGNRNGKQALIWETIVQTRQNLLPVLPEGITDWLEKAHDLTGDWFFKLIKGELENEFNSDK
jgi:uncharacterized protein (TIGR04255 family)